MTKSMKLLNIISAILSFIIFTAYGLLETTKDFEKVRVWLDEYPVLPITRLFLIIIIFLLVIAILNIILYFNKKYSGLNNKYLELENNEKKTTKNLNGITAKFILDIERVLEYAKSYKKINYTKPKLEDFTFNNIKNLESKKNLIFPHISNQESIELENYYRIISEIEDLQKKCSDTIETYRANTDNKIDYEYESFIKEAYGSLYNEKVFQLANLNLDDLLQKLRSL